MANLGRYVALNGMQFGRNAAEGLGYASSMAKSVRGLSKGVISKKRKTMSGSAPRTGSYGGGGYAGRIVTKKKRTYSKKRKSVKRKSYKRKRNARVKGENHFASLGATSTREISGTITDGDCVYIGHSSMAPTELLRVTVYALMRKLYIEATGWDGDNLKSIIPYRMTATNAQVSDGHKVVVKYVDNLALNTKNQYVLPVSDPSQTLESIGNLMANWFFSFSSQEGIWKDTRLLWIAIIDDGTGFMRAHIDLTSAKVDVYTKSELKIQNCTIPETGATTEDNVLNQPLVGRSYRFNSYLPQSADDDQNYIDALDQETGVTTWRANHPSGQQYETWKEPPPSKAFVNCAGSTQLRLEPGHIKMHTNSTRKTMGFENLLIALAVRPGNNNQRSTRVGEHDLFALERVLQIAGVLPIKLIYECNIMTCATVSTRKRHAIMQRVTYVTQNSMP